MSIVVMIIGGMIGDVKRTSPDVTNKIESIHVLR